MQHFLKNSSIVLSSVCASLIACHFYLKIADPVEKIFIEKEEEAILAAERTVQFSDRFTKAFNSTSPTDFTSSAEAGREAVVFIRSKKKIDNGVYKNTYSASTGSGVIITENGYIVTNNHVIEDADEIEITMNNNKEYKASIVGRDPSTDLALLKVEEVELPYLLFGNSDSLAIGEWVMAVGNPFRLQSTVTAGIVSAKARDINILQNYGVESFIQTDAAVNPGNSGGALINTNGELVGINAAILTYSGKYEGFSFAIPANLVRKIITDLKEFGSVQRGWLGVSINDVTDGMAQQLGLKEVMGAYIVTVNKDGAADEAGIKTGDVVIGVNDRKINSTAEFMEYIATFRPGNTIKIEFVRNGFTMKSEVTLRNTLNSTDIIPIRKEAVLKDLGFELRDLDTNEKQLHQHGAYVVSVEADSKIHKTNMEPGFIIKKINNTKVENVDQLLTVLQTVKGEVIVEGFYENYPGEFPYRFFMD